ncbi:MAG TPA: hypothetical protein VMH41_14965, partial [Mycobacteriales bacterium]|nr:hypothetical protein [Mycobacteriales bacterium]
HHIWALTSGVPTCPVSATDGGGAVPGTPGSCSSSTPPWYHTTGLTQGPNLVNAAACNYSGGNCYVLTDRGTFQYLMDSGAILSLHVVTRDNSATSTGGASLLINSFHAYAINPAKFPETVASGLNLAGATTFLDWLTSPRAQREITAYQEADTNSGGSSFIGDAAPVLSLRGRFPARVAEGRPVTVNGTLANRVPGTRPLSGVTVTLAATRRGADRSSTVATATTGASGRFSITFTPTVDARYRLASPRIAQVETPASASFGPEFGDLLQPASEALGRMRVSRTGSS